MIGNGLAPFRDKMPGIGEFKRFRAIADMLP
jgi:hypothetical protein